MSLAPSADGGGGYATREDRRVDDRGSVLDDGGSGRSARTRARAGASAHHDAQRTDDAGGDNARIVARTDDDNAPGGPADDLARFVARIGIARCISRIDHPRHDAGRAGPAGRARAARWTRRYAGDQPSRDVAPGHDARGRAPRRGEP